MAKAPSERIVAFLHPKIAAKVRAYADKEQQSISWAAAQLIEAAVRDFDLEAE